MDWLRKASLRKLRPEGQWSDSRWFGPLNPLSLLVTVPDGQLWGLTFKESRSAQAGLGVCRLGQAGLLSGLGMLSYVRTEKPGMGMWLEGGRRREQNRPAPYLVGPD